ncbi:MAG: DM13 domain-containing protein [Kiloniellales bacterium]|nr:DM13 domain-containing protein [Kiloniellales bacterium]
MLKWFLAVLGGGVVGGAIGFAAGIFVYPYIFLADIVATEEVADAAARQTVATGGFVHADPSDPIHYGRGRLTLYEDLLHLESDFEVGPGPKFHVYLVPDENVTPDTDVEATMFVDLGRLKAFKGSQNYPVPAGVTLSDYGSVVIWCEQFGVLISPAKLDFGA